MKATGIVRRIDDLGRVVIPKEIRRTLKIREGDPLEIYTNSSGEVIFKKYSPIGELGRLCSGLCRNALKDGWTACLHHGQGQHRRGLRCSQKGACRKKSQPRA